MIMMKNLTDDVGSVSDVTNKNVKLGSWPLIIFQSIGNPMEKFLLNQFQCEDILVKCIKVSLLGVKY